MSLDSEIPAPKSQTRARQRDLRRGSMQPGAPLFTSAGCVRQQVQRASHCSQSLPSGKSRHWGADPKPSPLLPIKAYPQWPHNPLTSQFLSSVTSVQSLSCVRLPETPWTAARQASLSITNSGSPHKPMSIESVMPSNHLILCCPLLLLSSIFPSIKVFSSESVLHIRWPK